MKFLIAGLGNIGEEYLHTRHNAGFDVLDAFVKRHNSVFQPDRLADVAEVKWKGKSIICIKPSTYMNLSGKAVKFWVDKLKLPFPRLLVIVDELALPLSKLRLNASGSDGGHNGLRSIEEALGTRDYARLRFGIGNNYPRGKQSDYVLSKWNSEEEALVKLKIERSAGVIESFVSMGIVQVMNEINNKEFSL